MTKCKKNLFSVISSLLGKPRKRGVFFSGQSTKRGAEEGVIFSTKPRGGGLKALVDCPLKKYFFFFYGFPLRDKIDKEPEPR